MAPAPGLPITGDAVYRGVAPGFAALPGADPSAALGAPGPDGVQLAGDDHLATHPVAGDAELEMVVPTIANARRVRPINSHCQRRWSAGESRARLTQGAA